MSTETLSQPMVQPARHIMFFDDGDATAAAAGDDGGGDVKFTPEQQKQIDKIIQKRVAREKTEKQELLTQLEQFKANKSLTEEVKSRLQSQIDKLTASMMTKEELAAREKKELEADLTGKLKVAEETAQIWQTRYITSAKRRELIDAAVAEEAFKPTQIVALLEPNTRLDEVLDADNKPTGEYTVMVTLDSVDEEGKPVKLDLPAREALKQMKKMTDEYGNLFKSGVTAGMGGTTFPGNVGAGIDVSNVDAYVQARRKGTLTLEQVSKRLLK